MAVVAGLSGCGGGASAAVEPTGALSVVVGARSNVPPPAVDGRAASAVDMAAAQQSEFSLVVADGAPFAQPTDIGRVGDGDRTAIEELLGAAQARTPEVDLLAAMGLAAEQLAGSTGPRTMVVLDSGLSTAGALDFTTSGLIDAHPQEVADALRDAGQLPDLTGISVVFHGLGRTAAPQAELDAIRRSQLGAIWTEVALEAGASTVHVEQGAAVETAAATSLPPVSTVDPGPGFVCSGETMTISGGPFAYQPNSDQFIDPPTTMAVLRGIAEQLRDRNITATLFGTTASVGEPADQVRFSDERAQAVADVLIELQVPIPQLHVEGLGSDFPGFVADRDAQGRLLPAAAALNRTVMVEFTAPVTC